MPEFFQTIAGRKFFEADVPRALSALEKIAVALDNTTKNHREKAERYEAALKHIQENNTSNAAAFAAHILNGDDVVTAHNRLRTR
jgi:hypothetical protein